MPIRKVLLAEPRGFCAGVEMAIKALAWMVRRFEPPIYCYHEIVHNQVVVDRFRDLGLVDLYLVADDVAELLAVDVDQLVADLDAGGVGRTSGRDGNDSCEGHRGESRSRKARR